MRNTVLLLFAVFLLLGTAFFVALRLDQAIGVSVRERMERREKVHRFRKRSRFSVRTEQLLLRCHDLIADSRMPKGAYFLLTGACAVGGFFGGKLIFSSTVIALAVGIFGLIAPLLLFSHRRTKANTARLEKLASSMMILSNSYIITEDIISTVRDNLEILEYPAPFRDFLTYTTMLDSSISAGLRWMERQVNNAFFSQWIDVLDLSQQDRALKYVTASVVESMHDVLSVQSESDAAMYAVWRDYLLTLIMIFCVPLIFRFVMPDGYVTLTTSLGGQAMFLALLVAVVFSLFQALKINKPLMI